jgi:hypothetical protein
MSGACLTFIKEDTVMLEWIVVLAAVSALSATGFIVVAVMWLCKLRETVSVTLAEAARQQVHTTQRLSDAIAHMQKQQRGQEQQLQILSQSNTQLRQGLVTVANRLDVSQTEAVRGDQTVH